MTIVGFAHLLSLASATDEKSVQVYRRRRGFFFSLDRKETNLSAAKVWLLLKTTRIKA